MWKADIDISPLAGGDSKPRKIKSMKWTLQILKKRIITKTGTDTWRFEGHGDTTPMEDPRFRTTRDTTTEEEEEDVFRIEMEEEKGETEAAEMDLSTGTVSGTIRDDGTSAVVDGATEAAATLAAVGTWEGIGAGAFEGGANGSVSGTINGAVEIPPTVATLNGDLGGSGRIPIIPITMKPRNGTMKWKMKDRLTYDKGVHTEDFGTFQWVDARGDPETRTMYELEPRTSGIFIVWKTPEYLRHELEFRIQTDDQLLPINKLKWALAWSQITDGRCTLSIPTVTVYTHEILWCTVYWKSDNVYHEEEEWTLAIAGTASIKFF
jgi:hypothetical protein